ncbi:MAG TPA: hypothetical protein VLS89_10805, partial [Candidatus Nanopelagicales bacterium]|nr:hypothetical protein [Candidatus Nanopelagicales bacterium]
MALPPAWDMGGKEMTDLVQDGCSTVNSWDTLIAPMARPGQITATPIHVPSVLVVLDAAWPELFARCLGAAVRSGVLVHRCEVAAASTFAAERRPLAIVLSNAVYALDPDEFDALARDVRAALLKVDEEITERELEAMFSAALRERERRDDSSGGGSRYALIHQVEAEAPMPRASQPPGPRTQAPPPSSRAMQLAGLRPSQAPPPSTRSGAMTPVPGSVRVPQPPRSTPTL